MKTINTYFKDYQSLNQFIVDNKDLLFDKKNQSVLIQIFSGVCEESYLSNLIQMLSKLLPDALMIGTTTSGEIMNGNVSGLKTVLSFSIFKSCKLKQAFAQVERNRFCLKQSVIESIRSNEAQILLLFSSGMLANDNQLLEELQTLNPNLAVAGGKAGDNFNNKQAFVFCNEYITDCGFVGIVIEGDNLSYSLHSHLCWQPIGKELEISRVEGSRVYTINHIPAFQIYKNYLGVTDRNDNIINSMFPMIVNRQGYDVVKTPFLVYEDESIEFSSDLLEGEMARFSFGHVDMIIEAINKLVKDIKEQPVESIFVYSCVSRRGFLQESIEIETMPLEEIAPTSGFYANGEFFHVDQTNQIRHASMTTLVLSESNDTFFQKNEREIVRMQESASSQLENKDHVESKSIVIVKALTNLIDKVTNELSERTKELEKVNEEVQYFSMHDSLTDLFNRNYYEQYIRNTDRLSTELAGIIICDVDGLKLINDTFGHQAGDNLLKTVANLLKSLFYPENIIARIGGDEFSILLKKSYECDIKDSIMKIFKAIEEYNSNSPTVLLSVSIGYASFKNGTTDINVIFKEADNSMYRQKLHKRKSIRGDLVRTLIKTLEARDLFTEQHCERLQELLVEFSEYINIPDINLSELSLFASFHDIGKVGIPDSILFKPAPLNEEEKREMQQHSEIGYRIALSSADLLPIAEWILKHHERWDGEGYPLKLKGEEIPLECRIIAIIDAFDAMTSVRPYREAMSIEEAVKELVDNAGKQFDPVLVGKFVEMLQK